MFDEVSVTTDAEAAAALFIQMNDIVINDFVEVPLVQRAAEKLAVLNSFNQANLSCSAFEMHLLEHRQLESHRVIGAARPLTA